MFEAEEEMHAAPPPCTAGHRHAAGILFRDGRFLRLGVAGYPGALRMAAVLGVPRRPVPLSMRLVAHRPRSARVVMLGRRFNERRPAIAVEAVLGALVADVPVLEEPGLVSRARP